jgi:ADP-heptose:LPS heptosyltransferase
MSAIGVLNLTRFGDLIQTTPVITGLHKRYPDREIHLIVKKRFCGAAELLPGVTHIHAIESAELVQMLHDPALSFVERYRRSCAVLEPLERLRFDVLLNFTHSRLSAVLLSLLDAERRVGFDLDREGKRLVRDPWLALMGALVRSRRLLHLNLVDVYLGAAGLCGSGERLAVRIPEPARRRAAELVGDGGPLVALQLGASQDQKTWPRDRWARTLAHLARDLPGLRVALVGVADEVPIAARLRADLPEIDMVDLTARTSLAELAAVLERARLLLTADTGTMHLGAAVGTPICAVFVGLSSPDETAPYGEGHWIVRSRIECAPCHHLVRCGAPLCHEDVPPEWLAELARRILVRERPEGLPALARADLLRTRFDERGLLELEPAHARTPRADDLLALAYRSAFVDTMCDLAPCAEQVWRRAERRFGVGAEAWPDHVPLATREALRELAELGREGGARARRLRDPRLRASSAREQGARLSEIDARVAALGRADPRVAPLTHGLGAALEALPDGTLPELAACAGDAYAALGLRAARVLDLCEGRSVQTRGAAR